ncbi:hypothetical protein PPERSA_03522 [Pseudocohnilembus persalinus]|uniref:Uncharacterized protein n=1 Tax=Pseudocohnilembus persalinus TaxID=266149 RepID=A0A0V0R2B7_PSEPJ|nr:hypothetical protein PPERSA_03522 [Pseudocohnilembus persalinus]|eukprot:KRX08651.1 hypothetical protein PPERSA_03522 [Pseudocohnilembus persalinus]
MADRKQLMSSMQSSFYQKPKEKFNRPNFINKVDDIDIGKKLNKQPDNENNSDVYKKANFIYKKTPGKIFNPINPSIPILTKIYKQKTEKEEPVVQNYLIGTINKSAYDNLMTRTHYPNNGIDTKKIQQKEYKNKYDNLKVEDINTGEKKQKAYRNTNPLWPEYNITIDKNKTLFNQTNYIKDIKGTEVGSALNKFYVANRQTNPLKPEYQLLGVKNPNSHLFNGLSKVLDTKPKYHTNLIKKPESDSQLQSKVYPQITKMENYQSKLKPNVASQLNSLLKKM